MPRGSSSAGRRPPAYRRLPLLAAAFVALGAGVAGGLARIGWQVDAGGAAAWHGPLMVCGFFGTVIGLERAVALDRGWPWLAPIASGLGGLALLAGAVTAAVLLLTAASVVMLAGSVDVWRRQRALFTLTLVLGASCWLAGNGLWLAAGAIQPAVPWWIGFLVLTIAGERLELSRLLPSSTGARHAFAAIVAWFVGALAATLVAEGPGLALAGLALVALAAWLVRHDIARWTVRTQGLTRFVAVSLLSGYAWLAAGGALLAAAGAGATGHVWDAALHALMLGFVFAMVFGHAPLIFPAVVRVAIPYHPTFYLPLALLHASVAARVAADLAALPGARAAAGMASAAALAAFVLSTLAAVVRGRRALRAPDGPPGPAARRA